MDLYSNSIATLAPPVVALLDNVEHHANLATWIGNASSPSIVTLSLPSVADFQQLLGNRRQSLQGIPDISLGGGLLEADWLSRQQTEHPAVVAMLVELSEVSGDPTSWAHLVGRLDALRLKAKTSGLKVLIIVLQSHSDIAANLPEDRASMVCRHAGIDRKYILPFTHSSSEKNAAQIQQIVAVIEELALGYYAGETQRRLAAHAEANDPSIESRLRAAFKLGYVAECRKDYEAAYTMYSEAFSYVFQLQQQYLANGREDISKTIQNHTEMRAVAEVIHVKLMAVLLFGLSLPREAASQLSRHLHLFKYLLSSTPIVVCDHWSWISQQYKTAAELFVSSGSGWADLPHTKHPPQLLLAAAEALVERRKVGQQLSRTAPSTFDINSITQGAFVGQYVSAADQRPLNNDDYTQYITSLFLAANHSAEAIALLETARTALQQSSSRSATHAGLLLAEEFLLIGNKAGAKTILDEVTATYRAAGEWKGPLYRALLLSKECAVAFKNSRAQVACSLEAAAIDQPTTRVHRQALAQSALDTLLMEGSDNQAVATPGGVDSRQLGSGMFHFVAEADPSRRHWLQNVFRVTAGIFTLQDNKKGQVGVALYGVLPVAVPITRAEISFTDQQGAITVDLKPCDDTGSTILATTITIQPGDWCRFVVDVPTRCAGSSAAVSITLYIGTNAIITLPLSIFTNESTREEKSVFAPSLGFNPGKLDCDSSPSTTRRHSAPIVDLISYKTGLVGEDLPVYCRITAGDHAISNVCVEITAVHRDTGKSLDVVMVDDDSSSKSHVAAIASKASQIVECSISTIKGQIEITANVEYQGEVTGSVIATALVQVEVPFSLDLQFISTPCTQYHLESTPSTSDTNEVEANNNSMMSGLSLGSPTASDAAAMLLPIDIAQITASWPRQVILPAGVDCTAIVALKRQSSSCPHLVIEAVEWRAAGHHQHHGVGVKPVSKTAAVGSADGIILDHYQSLFSIQAAKPAQLQSLGKLNIKWRRCLVGDENKLQLLASSSVASATRNDVDIGSNQLDGINTNVSDAIEYTFKLPAAVFKKVQVSATPHHAPNGSIGRPFTFEVSVVNAGTTPKDIVLTVEQPKGFMIAGERNTVGVIAPEKTVVYKWELVPYHAGYLELPDIVLKSTGSGGFSMQVTRNCHMMIQHSP